MKKVMWTISILALALTIVVLQFMPDLVPVHYNSLGEIDRWGSKYENLLFPVCIIAMSLVWHLLIGLYEKKTSTAGTEKECAESAKNAMVLKIVGISMASLFTAMQAFILYGQYVDASMAATHANVDIPKITCILLGVLFVILGNFMPKTKKNYAVGLRTSWSMYNDVTWMKSNRFGAVAMMIAGLLTIVTAIFTESMLAIIMLLVYLFAATTIVVIYSYKIYKEELTKEQCE